MENKIIDSDFDGHIEKELKNMTPKEKLDYLWNQIELKHYIKNNVKKVENKNF